MNSKYSFVIIALLLLGLLDLSQSQVSKTAKCPSIAPKSGLKISDIGGMWYESKHYASSFLFGTCVTMNIVSNGDELSITTNQSYPTFKTVPQTVTFNRHKGSKKTGQISEPGIYKFKLSMGLGKTS